MVADDILDGVMFNFIRTEKFGKFGGGLGQGGANISKSKFLYFFLYLIGPKREKTLLNRYGFIKSP